MVDVSHEPRWGRIVEGAGEDPYLNSVMAAARVRARRATTTRRRTRSSRASSTSSPTASRRAGATTTRPTCPSQRLRNLYLPPFKAAIDAGADTVMCSFNAINGVAGLREPVHRDGHPQERVGLRRLHRERLHGGRRAARLPAASNPDSGPCGHGVAADGPEAAAHALNAGTDSEMVSTNYRDYGKQLVAAAPVSMKRIDDAVRRILRDQVPRRAVRAPVRRRRRRARRSSCCRPTAPPPACAAGRSMVLLKNDGNALPLDAAEEDRADRPAAATSRARHARPVVGPRATTPDAVVAVRRHEGAEPEHHVHGRAARSPTTISTTRRASARRSTIAAASRPRQRPPTRSSLALGETREMSGEAEARSNIDLPGQPAGPDRRGQGDRQAVRGRAVQRRGR